MNAFRIATSISSELMRQRSKASGNHYVLVSEYPKAGGTWLARMIADYANLPLPQSPRWPVFGGAVVHNHWPPNQRFPHRTVYVYRDGRDVMVSLLFQRLRESPSGVEAEEIARHQSIDEGVIRFLPSFVAQEASQPRPRSLRGLNWAEHIQAWRTQQGGRLICTTYEALHSDTVSELKRVLELLALPVDSDRIVAVVQRHSFRAQSGRNPGQADPDSFLRKGVVGDWRNYFTQHSAEVFLQYFPRTLVELGFEDDSQWATGLG